MIEFIRDIYNECAERDGYDCHYEWSWTTKFDHAINAVDATGELTKLSRELELPDGK